jgi:putative addiction module CopG family antidote
VKEEDTMNAMTRITVKLPATIKAYIDKEVASGAFPSADKLICHLLQESRKQRSQKRIEARKRMEALIDEGLESGEAIPMPADYFEKKLRRLRERVISRKSR